MFTLNGSLQFLLYRHPTDMRKSFDALCGLIISAMQKNPASGEVFMFINKSRNKMKLLHWETGGFVLYYKRLESGTFELPNKDINNDNLQLSYATLVMMTEGISMKNIMQRKRFSLKK